LKRANPRRPSLTYPGSFRIGRDGPICTV
jgi:hypothetical protein